MANEQADGLLAVGEDSKALGTAFQDTTGKVGRVLLAGRTQAAGYQAIIRDIALAADAVKPGAWSKDSEWLIGKEIDRSARETGVSRDGLAQAVGRMVGEGMGYEKALELAPLVAKFAVGQKADGGDSGSLMAMLDADFGVDAGQMPAVMARIASFGKAEKIDRAELVKVLPVLLRDLKNVGITGEAALAQAQAILKQRMVIDGDAQAATKYLHESLQKLRGKGSEAELKKGRDAIRAYSGNQSDEYGANAGADVQALNRDHAARSGTESSKWARAGHAIERAGLNMGQAVQPLTTYAADKVASVANGAADVVENHPLLAAGAATAAAGYGLYRSGKTIGSALGLFGGKGKDGGDGVQKVEVTNWPQGTGMAGAGGAMPNGPGMPEGPGGRRGGGSGPRTGPNPRPRTWLGRIGGSLRSAGSGLTGIARGAWAGRAVIAAGVKPLLRFGVPGLTALYTAGELAATLSGGSEQQKRNAYAGAAAEVAGGVIGAFVGGPVGLAVGPWLGRMASDYIVDKLAGSAPAPAGKPVAAAAVSAAAGVVQAASVVQGAALQLPAPPSGPSGMVALPRTPAYMEQLFASQRGLPGAALFAPAAVATAAKGGGARVTAASTPAASAVVPTDAAREGALQAAVSAASARSAQAPSRPPGAAAVAQPAQINFKPSISVTVQGDVREPRRIAEELMPYLRQLFDQFQGQQQRSSLFDAPLTAEGIAT